MKKAARAHWIQHTIICTCVGAAVSSVTSLAVAGDLDGTDFSLRFPAAISRFGSYADVAAAGGAQAASEWLSSVNPASAAWPHPARKYAHSFAPQFSAINFDEGTALFVASEALTVDGREWGVFLPAAAQIRSNHEQDSSSTGFQFEADYFQLQWGKLIASDWAIGANVNLTLSETKLDVEDVKLARARGESYSFRFGVVHQAIEKLRIGLVLDYAFAPGRTTIFDAMGLGIGNLHSEDTTHQFLFRPGIAWEYTDGCDLYADYQGGWFHNDTGTLWVHRFAVGVDHMVIKDILYARLGTMVDTYGNVAGTTGMGLSVSERVSIDVAYQYNMFPEIRAEFGHAHTCTLSVGIGF